jgi:hypothetical protein
MQFNEQASINEIKELLSSKLAVAQAWDKFVAYCEGIRPKPYWHVLRQLNVADEQKDIVAWIEQILTVNPLPKSIMALWIGIEKIWDEESNREYVAICLRGADHYDPEDIDWADEPRYEPENNYGIVGVLTDLNDLIREDAEDYALLAEILPLAYCALTLDEIIRKKLIPTELTERAKHGLYVTVGFDEGQHLDLSRIE